MHDVPTPTDEPAALITRAEAVQQRAALARPREAGRARDLAAATVDLAGVVGDLTRHVLRRDADVTPAPPAVTRPARWSDPAPVQAWLLYTDGPADRPAVPAARPSNAGWRGFLAFLLLGRNPACAARHPEQRRVRCEIAPHGAEHLHQGGRLLWNDDGPVPRPPRPGPDYVHPYPRRHGPVVLVVGPREAAEREAEQRNLEHLAEHGVVGQADVVRVAAEPIPLVVES